MIGQRAGGAQYNSATNLRWGIACLMVVVMGCVAAAQADSYPQPSPYPVSWQFDFTQATPRRIVVQVPGKGATPFYYLTYTVTNRTGEERLFLPNFVMVTRDGKSIRSDTDIPAGVFDAIKQEQRNPSLKSANEIAGTLRQGDDQAQDGVAIWPEPSARMGAFSIYVGGLSGEYVTLKDDKGNPVKDDQGNPIILRKTLQLNYLIPGDEIYPGEDEINQDVQRWVMR